MTTTTALPVALTQTAKKRVKDWMTPNPITVLPTTFVNDAYQLMREQRIRRLPVVELGQLIGIVTLGDLRSLGAGAENDEVLKIRVEAAMHPNLITIAEDATLVEAARTMIQHKISGLPVLSASHHTLIGIITESDILRAFIADETQS